MDKLVLHALSYRTKFNNLRRAVPDGAMSTETTALLAWFKAYFAAFPDRERVDLEELKTLIKLRSGHADADSTALTIKLADVLKEPVSDSAVQGIIGQLYELDLAGRASAAILSYNRGDEIDLPSELQVLVQGAVRNRAQTTPQEYIDTPIQELLEDLQDHSKGLTFDIDVLKSTILPVMGGASIAIGGRPDKGKTSLVSSILTHFAPQVVNLHGGSRPICWFNNEGSGKRIIPRVYQAALQKDLDEIITMSNAGELTDAYTKAVGGIPDVIRVKDMHGASMAQLEQVVEVQKPAVIVADMLANFRLGTNDSNRNKADIVERLWQTWRELLVRHDCVGIATAQISVEGDNQLFPPYSALKDSKTGIQGATDVIILLGARNEIMYSTLRGLSVVKNKFAFPKKPALVESEITFDASRCMFY